VVVKPQSLCKIKALGSQYNQIANIFFTLNSKFLEAGDDIICHHYLYVLCSLLCSILERFRHLSNPTYLTTWSFALCLLFVLFFFIILVIFYSWRNFSNDYIVAFVYTIKFDCCASMFFFLNYYVCFDFHYLLCSYS